MRLLLLTLLAALTLCGCADKISDSRLARAEALADASPQAALDSLRSIDYHSLTEADRHYYDFLSVKVPDKAYVDHVSDSLILSVISYESGYKANGRYPEALYYGGRVYSDLGDYPTALRYFQDAIDATASCDDMNLRANILSQTGRLLTKLRLYDEAIPYLKQVLHIDSIERDTFGLAYDHRLIGFSYLNSDRPDTAKEYFGKALHWASHMSATDSANIMVYLAAASYESNDNDSALSMIRHLSEKVNPMYINLCLAYACDIYSGAGLLDTAYMYAMDLVHGADDNNKKTGFEHLLSPPLISMTPTDSIILYAKAYGRILEKSYNDHAAQQAIAQNSLYNYQAHMRERLKAEDKAKKLTIACLSGIAIILVLIITTLAYRIRSRQDIIRLHESIARINHLQQMLDSAGKCPDSQSLNPASSDATRLREQLMRMLERSEYEKKSVSIPQTILNSEAYEKLRQHIVTNSRIDDSDPLWTDLENLIMDASPNFKEKLHELIGESLKAHEMQTIILIKCGVTPTQMTHLLGISKGGVSSRRESLCRKILGEKVNIKYIDNIVRSL
ncbi:MAG: hypothetical protein NC127_09275 [Muribaculum sp.]|nr:hypothetical protein [Muribaculum sp.]